MESIRRQDKLGGNTFCSEMERCGEKEIMAERFKASTKKINQNLADVIVSVQTGCRTYQVEQPVSTVARHFSTRGGETPGQGQLR